MIFFAINILSFGHMPNKHNIFSKIPKIILEIIMLYIFRLFNISYKNSYYLNCFKKLIIVVMHKPKKENYIKTEAYWPIVLWNILGKDLKAIIEKIYNFLAIAHILFSKLHIKGRKKTLTNYICYHLIKAVYATQNSKK